jgi:hypothetical protein
MLTMEAHRGLFRTSTYVAQAGSLLREHLGTYATQLYH